MRSAPRPRPVVVAAAVLAAALAGCTSVQPASRSVQEPDSAATGAAPSVLTPAALDLAVRAGPYQQEQLLLSRAQRVLTGECMAARGYSYPTTGSDAVLDDPWHPDLTGRRIHGYGFDRPGPSPAGQYPPGLSSAQRARYERALSGDPDHRATLRLSSGPRFTFATTGCIAESRIRLYGDVMAAARADYVPQEAYNALYAHITGDPGMHEATRQWSDCMHGRGHPYPSMSAARDGAIRAQDRDRSAGEARRYEIQVAVADGECTLRAGIPAMADRIGRRHAGTLTVEQRRDLNTAAELRSAGLHRARAIA